MLTKIYVTIAIMLLSTVSVGANNTPTEVNGCTSRDVVEKILSDGEFVTLLRGASVGDKVNEIWINSKSYVMAVSYDKPTGNKRENIKQVCVTVMIKEAVYNGDVIDILSKSLEKAKPTL